jgi:hypothetical protein
MNPTVTRPTLFRLGGAALVVGGLLGPIGHLVLHPPSHAVMYQVWPTWAAAHTVLTISYALVLLGLFALYAKLSERMGVAGLIGFVFLVGMCLYQVFNYAYDAFTVPILLSSFPGETATGPEGPLPLPNGLFPLPLTFYVGILLFGIFTFRAQRAARWPALGFMLSMVFVFAGGAIAHSPLHYEPAIPIGFSVNSLAFAWMGVYLISQADQILSAPARADGNAKPITQAVAATPAGRA